MNTVLKSSFIYGKDKWRTMNKPKKRVIFGLAATCSVVLIGAISWLSRNAVEETSYYYTLSTICQTLAGAFAFLVAVALFRMQSVKNDMERALADVIPYAVQPVHQTLLQIKNRSHDWHEVERFVRQEMIDSLPGDELKSAVSGSVSRSIFLT